MDFNQRTFASHKKVKKKKKKNRVTVSYALTVTRFLALISVETGALYIDLIFFSNTKYNFVQILS